MREGAEHGDRVLIVDDELDNCCVVSGYLEVAGYEVESVPNGEAALARLAVWPVDLVLLDVMMPGIDGFEVCRRLRATPATADTPVLFLTALGGRESTEPALAAGADDLLGKPFTVAELLLRVRALIRLRRAQQQVQALEEQRRRLASMVVHDMRNATTAIFNNAEMIRESPAIVGEDAAMLDDILISVAQLDRLVANLLTVSRAQDGVLVARPESFDLSAVASDVAATMRAAARIDCVRVETDLRALRVVADRSLVHRLLENLVHNALKHSPPGAAILIESEAEAEAVILRVHDEGPGVPADLAERVFQPYVTEGASGPGRAGEGLGLTFCRLAAQVHGGSIWIENRTPRGASFCVRLPQGVA